MADSDIFFAKVRVQVCHQALRSGSLVPRHGRQKQLNCMPAALVRCFDCGGFRRLSYRGKGLLDGSRRRTANPRPCKMFDQRIETLVI